MIKPVLDPAPSGKPHDWQFGKIQMMKGVVELTFPPSYKNPYVDETAPRDQDSRGTCFSPNTRILMEDLTFKKISRVVVGDYVISHTGEKRLVTETMARKWQGNMIKMWIYGYDRPIEGTKEHPILTTDGWKSLGELKKKDYVAIPALSNLKGDKTIHVIESDPEFLWVLGLYLAEGNLEDQTTSGGRVIFSLHRKETEFAERVKSTMSKYGAPVAIRERESNGLVVTIAGQRWVDLFRELGGEYCQSKKLQTRTLYLDPLLQYQIYLGWRDGDGHLNDSRNNVQVVTTSEILIRQMQIILMRNNFRGNIQKRPDYQNGKRENWCLETANDDPRYGFFKDGYYWVHPRKIEKVPQYMSGQVYNLEVDVDNSYIAESVAVHNCVGQSTAHCFDLLYMMLTRDIPTINDKAQFKKNVVDQIGTTHDILYPNSASAESAYQMSRFIGNVTYPAGSEIRFAVRAWKEYGINLESQWHTDKKGTMVWMYPPGTRVTDDGGILPEGAANFAALHRIEGYAMCGTPDGGASWDEICYSIATKGMVLGAIPVYENYSEMQNGDGTFPDPGGEIAGYHALCFYGYDENYLYLLHSWGDWCGRFGKLSRAYYNYAQDQSVWMVVLDTSEVVIGKQTARTISIGSNVPVMISVNGVNAGYTPIKISVEPGKTYNVMASADGYLPKTVTVDGSVTEVSFTLEAVVEPQKKHWWEIVLSWLIGIFNIT